MGMGILAWPVVDIETDTAEKEKQTQRNPETP
jgi:hypothetical protein